MAFADMMTAARRRMKNYLRSTSGNLTMIAALGSIPVIAAAGIHRLCARGAARQRCAIRRAGEIERVIRERQIIDVHVTIRFATGDICGLFDRG